MTETTFADLHLPARLLQAVEALGFTHPTPIQRDAIGPLLAGRDVVGIAQTGTGKTAAFALPMLEHVDANAKQVQALVLAPTRELALQSTSAIDDLAAHCHRLRTVCVYGGASYGPQISALKGGAQVVVGTPGRIIDLMDKGYLSLADLRMVVLDEADEMLRMGFAEEVEKILTHAPYPGQRITALFSATMPSSIEQVAATHLVDPVQVRVSAPATVASTLEQTYTVVPFKFKTDALARVLAARSEDAAIVFVRTRLDADQVASSLIQAGVSATAISGDVSQSERERIVTRLRSGELDVLVATDVAARGLDVDRLGLVVNYDVPRDPGAYVHRVGRTGRAGRAGRALTFFTPREESRLRVIEKLTGTQMTETFIPSPSEVRQLRTRRLLAALPGDVNAASTPVLGEDTVLDEDVVTQEVQEFLTNQGWSAEELALALVRQAVASGIDEAASIPTTKIRREETVDEDGRFVAAVFEAGRVKSKAPRAGRGARTTGEGERNLTSGFTQRYRLAVGRRDGVRPADIVGAITGEAKVSGEALGRIDLFGTFSLVEVSDPFTDEQLARLDKARLAGRALRIREDTGKPPRKPKGTKKKRAGERGTKKDLRGGKKTKRSHPKWR